MSRSQFRNKSALFGCCLFICVISVVAGVPYEGRGSSRFFCEVNGRFYREGEHFASANNPELTCQCQRGYTGRNVEPYCRREEHDNFNDKNESQSTDDCVPITSSSKSPKYTHYTELQRCPSDKALFPIVITEKLKHSIDERSICTFGDKRLGIGDYFYHSMIDDTRNCVICTCRQPPKPTCQRPPTCPLVHV